MICATCKAAGVKSQVFGGQAGFSTLMGGIAYYDEDGKHHDHDPNSTTFSYTCSRGHRWRRVTYRKCWCGWNGGDDHDLEG